MSEDKELKQWKEKLFYQPKNGYDQIDAEQTGEIFAYAEGYKRFLDAARTEREAVKEAIRMAVRDLADGGAYITYPTGHRDRIDVAVRRCILTGVGQTAAAVAKKRAEDSGCRYMELTAHGGARPEHARWQGQLVQIQGKRTRKIIDGLKVFTLQEIGYGDGRGFKGWNCRHNWHPYYPGLSTPNYTPEEIANNPQVISAYLGSDDDTDSDDAKHESEEA